MSTPQDIARVLTKLQLRRRPDIDDDGMESWVDRKGRGNVEVSVSESGRWVIMWEESRAKGYGLGLLVKKLKVFLAQNKNTNEGLTAEELDELTGTGGIAGFGTPYAFAGNDEDKKKVNEVFEALMEGTRSTSDEIEKMLKQAGYKNLGAGAGSSDEWEKSYKTGTKTIFVNINGWNVNGGPQGDTVWQLKRYLASKEGASWQKGVNEAGDPYYGWRNDETKTPRQKIGNAITEINKQLKEVEKVVKRTQRLKKETGTSNNALWNRTNKALMKIEGRMHRISQTIRNMRG